MSSSAGDAVDRLAMQLERVITLPSGGSIGSATGSMSRSISPCAAAPSSHRRRRHR
jgi:hypothetical protein